MSRWRTHNNRRRAQVLKQGGLYTLQRVRPRERRIIGWDLAARSPVACLATFRDGLLARVVSLPTNRQLLAEIRAFP